MRTRALFGLAAVLAVFALSPVAAHGDSSTGSISGTVTDTTGSPLAGICVAAYPFSLGSSSLPTGGTPAGPTDASGTYVISSLSPGGYWVHFADCSGNRDFPLWNLQSPSYDDAKPIEVQAGATASGVNAQLGSGGSISGTVTDSSGTPQAGVCVSGSWQSGAGATENNDTVLTDSSGAYQLPVRAGDPYRVMFSICGYATNSGNFLTQYYNGQSDPAQATLVSADQGQTTGGIDAALQVGGQITGTVTDSSGQPVAGVCASTAGPSGESSQPSDASGHYVIQDLASGTAKVLFHECDNGAANWADQWYNDKPDEASADPVTVTAGQVTTGIDAAMYKAGSISGTVTDTAGNPLAYVCVEVSGSSAKVLTDANGHYFVPELQGGSHTVYFRTDCVRSYYLSQYYDGAYSQADATPVSVTFGQDTSGIDAQLVLGGRIAGNVTQPAGGTRTLCIQATDGSGHSYFGSVWGGGTSYVIQQVPPGRYSVEFSDCSSSPTYQTQWYDRQAVAAAADPVIVVGGQDTTGIDAAMDGALVPYVTGVSPAQGPAPGGTQVTISGAGFTGATAVLFGSRPATSVQVVSDSQITAIAPAENPGTVDVTVKGPAGTSSSSPSDRFTYKIQPTVTAVTPSSGTGGMLVKVDGTHLSAAQISFGTAAATVVQVLSDTSLLVEVPSHGPGTVDVTATLSGITSPLNPVDRYSYLA